ncbi:MAG: hypothetical protein Q4G26_13885 [Paracoccus sp. (in: a-proteobacteria)]|nr:hypothetical protein [Paracoccus sp. (in: a-proteobacteria)]
MTAISKTVPAMGAFQSPLARVLLRLAQWQESRHSRAAERVGIRAIPDNLRRDLGLGGGANRARHSGRSFDHSRHPDAPGPDWRF